MRIYFSVLIILFLSSCSKNTGSEELGKFSVSDMPQTWELASINAGMSGETILADEVSVIEIYVFKQNGVFSKSFKDDFEEGDLTGTYEIVLNEEREFLRLSYPIEMDSLSYCSRDRIENILISIDGMTLYNGGCLAFDGPAMNYLRTN